MALSENVVVALIVAVPALMSGPIVAWLAARNASKAREQDWKRQDTVAANAAESSRKLLASQEAAARLLEDNTRNAVHARQETYAQLQALHTLGNSHTTALVRAELDSTRREVAALREIMALKVQAGLAPNGGAARAVIEAADRRIAELEELMAQRKKADELALAQIEEGQSAGKIADAAAVAAKPAAEQAARKIVPPVVTETVPPVVKAAVKEALDEHDKKK